MKKMITPLSPQTRLREAIRIRTFLVAAMLVSSLNFAVQACAQNKVDFSRDIQPILSENCYFCHGPDANQRKSDLRLDLEEDAAFTFEPGEPTPSFRGSSDLRM